MLTERTIFHRVAVSVTLALGLGAALTQTAAVPAAQSPPAACAAPEYHQFDFWIGRWRSYDPSGALQGHLTVQPILGGCALEELWSGSDGGTGRSFSIYDRSRGVWNQTWVSSHGTLLPLEGRLVGHSMVLIGPHVQPDGRNALHRTIWTPLGNGQVRQIWDLSVDGGQTWQVNYDGLLKLEGSP